MGNNAATFYWFEELTTEQKGNLKQQIAQQYNGVLSGVLRYREVFRRVPPDGNPEKQLVYSFVVSTGQPLHQKVEILVYSRQLVHIFDRPFIVVNSRPGSGTDDICFVQVPSKST